MGGDASKSTGGTQRNGARGVLSDAARTACLSIDDCLTFLQGGLGSRDAEWVHRHLDECDDCRIVIAEAVRSVVEPGVASPRPVMRVLGDGERVADRYQIQRFVARGGMGEVYEALDTALGERVALKTLAITTADQVEAVEGLLREVRTARKVIHPNVCRILELGIHKHGNAFVESVPFLTMDFLVGETLRQRIVRKGPLPPADARRITDGLAAGLEAVHGAGIVHRDFKSDNVFLVQSGDGTERPVIMDFGLARRFEGSSVGTSAGHRLAGTASYMAPEQLTGQPATAATDVFALGIVLFEMLTGKLPFSGDSLAAVALSRLQQTPPPVSSLVPGIDPTWDAVIGRCLERIPQKRFSKMAELVAALDGIGAAPVPISTARPNRLWLAGMTAVVLAGAAAVLVLALRSDETPPPRTTGAAPLVPIGHPAHLAAPGSPPPGPLIGSTLPEPPQHQAAPARPRRRSSLGKTTTRAPAVLGAQPTGATVNPNAPADETDPFAPARPRARHPDDLADPF
jgi:hypothetical protein